MSLNICETREELVQHLKRAFSKPFSSVLKVAGPIQKFYPAVRPAILVVLGDADEIQIEAGMVNRSERCSSFFVFPNQNNQPTAASVNGINEIPITVTQSNSLSWTDSLIQNPNQKLKLVEDVIRNALRSVQPD